MIGGGVEALGGAARVEEVTAAEAAAKIEADRPLVLRGLADHWPAVAAARSGDAAIADYLSGYDRGAPIKVMVGPPEIGGRYFYADGMRGLNFTTEMLTMGALVERLLAMKGGEGVPSLYAGSTPTRESIAGFAADNRLPIDTGGVDPRIWIGNASRVAPHYDMSSNIAVVVAGRRRFTLFPPEQIANLYVGPVDRTVAGQPTSMVDLAEPDLDRFPRFAEALEAATLADLGPGDAIFIPPLWWHHVEAQAPFNVLVNYWYGQPDTRVPFAALMLAVQSIRELPEAERQAWRSWFDHYVFGEGAGAAADHLPDHARGVLGAPSPQRDRMILDYVKGMCSRAAP